MKLLFATTNKGKLAELRHLMGPAAQVLSLADFPGLAEPEEDADTFEGNARKKALQYAKATGVWTVADDSGLCVDALDGRPGVYSARYAPGDDRARYEKLLGELKDVPDERRGASFRCALCLASPAGETVVEVGELRGRIGHVPRGEHGFGYDPVFVVPELGRTVAELSHEEKGRISHRGRAFEKMRPHLLARMER